MNRYIRMITLIVTVLIPIITATCANHRDRKETRHPIQVQDTLPQKAQKSIDYRTYPLAYITTGGKLVLADPETKKGITLQTEPDSVLTCTFAPDNNNKLYYTSARNNQTTLKCLTVGENTLQTNTITRLPAKTAELSAETYGTPAKMHFLSGRVLIEYGFSWEAYDFTQYIAVDPATGHTEITDRFAWEGKPKYTVPSPFKWDRDFRTQYPKLLQKATDIATQDPKWQKLISQMTTDESESGEPEACYALLSPNGKKMAFSLLVVFGDYAHGPSFVCNVNGSDLVFIPELDAANLYRDWCGSRFLYLNTVEHETPSGDFTYEYQLKATSPHTNKSYLLAPNVVFFAVKH